LGGLVDGLEPFSARCVEQLGDIIIAYRMGKAAE
jgi:hypothetical protein